MVRDKLSLLASEAGLGGFDESVLILPLKFAKWLSLDAEVGIQQVRHCALSGVHRLNRGC